jgi:hypothetical protein
MKVHILYKCPHCQRQAMLPLVRAKTTKGDPTPAMLPALNGRQDRAVKLALEGHVTHIVERILSVCSEDGRHSCLVNLGSSFCSCPESLKWVQ